MKRTIRTPLGYMLAISDEHKLYYLHFTNDTSLEHTDQSPPLLSIEKEIELYFAGKLKEFTTPISIKGTPFQEMTWKKLQAIPYGTTKSYAELAKDLNHPKAFRAVGGANNRNKLAIIIPCHRVINKDGTLGGYASGAEKKKRLIDHEKALFW